ncbi:unnamed protein product [Clonostachys solani]|uniref:Uncharacterized protein n=1 Tax=Clonostachys solani TaxID=160281 RepID=A0A9N9Z943_9HYPO|nr:unnamed protein product [Clonostachys solani]
MGINALRSIALADFQNQKFQADGAIQKYSVISAHSAVTAQLQLDERESTLSDIERLCESDETPLLIVKVLYQRPISDHIFDSTPEECRRLLELFQIDSYGLGLVANDANGFHSLGEDLSTGSASYYLQCTAYKILWSYDRATRRCRAVAFSFNRPMARKGFDDFKASLQCNAELLSHPLILPMACLAQAVGFMDGLIRRQYTKCHKTENSIGYHHPQRIVSQSSQEVNELSDLSKNTNALKLEVEMILRRLRQLLAAIEVYAGIQRDFQSSAYPDAGNVSELDTSTSVVSTLSLIKTKLEVMELDFLYVGARADALINTIFHLMTRNDALATIELARATARDSSSMKVLAIMTMAFLPGTFFAALFSVPSLQWNTEPVVQDKFWVYWAFTLPFTALVFTLWALLTQAEELGKLRAWVYQIRVSASTPHNSKELLQDETLGTSVRDSKLGEQLKEPLSTVQYRPRETSKRWEV